MELSLLIVILLLILAIIGLVVGVANDAVNFLNAALGSHAAKYKVILTFAVLGLIVGVTFSSGMMNIAKSGIFHPEYFNITDLMFIFISVMFTSVLILDLFNTFGLPTSTTITLVAGLFGAALSISFFKLTNTNPEQIYQIVDYLNVANLLKIFTGIVLSIGIAFICGFITQFFARLIFTFDYKKRLKRYGGIWIGFAITTLMYFIFLKGIRYVSFISQETINIILTNQTNIFIITFIASTLLGQLLLLFTKLNILKFIVLLGIFSLALSFAANDLVNFIGAPLAGLTAYQIALTLPEPLTTTLGALATTKVQAETWMLLLAGIIMSLTLIFSKKARNVTETEVSLGRQEDITGFERFESNAVARSIVRMNITIFDSISNIIPRIIKVKVNKRFNIAKYKPVPNEKGEYPSFDLLRASVILTVSSALISFGTSLKLPLSTTYITFIVAMATAFADRSWGRDSAVYRVSGVVTVIGGWFFTAFVSVALAFIIASFIYFTNYIGIIIISVLIVFSFIKTSKLHKEKAEKEKNKKGRLKTATNELELANNIQQNISEFINDTSTILISASEALIKGDLKELKAQHKISKSIALKTNPIINELLKTLSYTSDENIEKRELLPRTITSFVSIADNLLEITKSMQSYIDNNHYLLLDIQIEELQICCELLENFKDKIIIFTTQNNLALLEKININIDELKSAVKKNNKNQLKRIKKNPSAMKRSMLFITIMQKFDNYIDDLKIILEAIKEAIETEQTYNLNN